MDIKRQLAMGLEQAAIRARELGQLNFINLPRVFIEEPPQKDLGDFASNFALQTAKFAKTPPRMVAQSIVNNFSVDIVKKIEVAGPGFLNFYLKDDWQAEVLADILSAGDKYGNSDFGRGKKILLEFVSANPTGPLHVGHGRGAAYGSALANLLTAAGFVVGREHYVNDIGNQIHNLALSVDARYRELFGQAGEFPVDGYKGIDIIATAQGIIDRDGDKYLSMPVEERVAILGEIALQEKTELLKSDLANFGVYFDSWFSERSVHEDNLIAKTCAELERRGEIYRQDGACWLKTSSYGDDKDRVLIRSSGVSTYFAADIAYHQEKIGRGYDTLINIWGADHHGYVGRMKAAIEALDGRPDSLELILLQMVHLYRNGELVKISKRTGQGITLRELIEEVGRDASRYFFIMRSPDSQLDFDIDLAMSNSNDNPVYYIQYAYARIASIFRALSEVGIELVAGDADLKLLCENCELDIIRKLAVYPEEVAYAAGDRAPHRLASFIHELAGLFHTFYNQCRIIGVETNLQQARMQLILAVSRILKHGLDIIGVDAPERM